MRWEVLVSNFKMIVFLISDNYFHGKKLLIDGKSQLDIKFSRVSFVSIFLNKMSKFNEICAEIKWN